MLAGSSISATWIMPPCRRGNCHRMIPDDLLGDLRYLSLRLEGNHCIDLVCLPLFHWDHAALTAPLEAAARHNLHHFVMRQHLHRPVLIPYRTSKRRPATLLEDTRLRISALTAGSLDQRLSQRLMHLLARGRHLLDGLLQKINVSGNHCHHIRYRRPHIPIHTPGRQPLRLLICRPMVVAMGRILSAVGLGTRQEIGMLKDPYSRTRRLHQPDEVAWRTS